jgi:hypothetical protein
MFTNSQEEKNAALAEERQRIRDADSDLIDEAIGVKTKRRRAVDVDMQSEEIKRILTKGAMERGDVDIGMYTVPVYVCTHVCIHICVYNVSVCRHRAC